MFLFHVESNDKAAADSSPVSLREQKQQLLEYQRRQLSQRGRPESTSECTDICTECQPEEIVYSDQVNNKSV